MVFEELKRAIIDMDDKMCKQLVNEAIKSRIAPLDILNKGLIPGIKEVGELFARKEYYVPEVLLASETFYTGFNIVKPLIKSQGNVKKTKVVIGVVEGDIHDIGKNIVRVLTEASGYEVVDLGKDIPTKKLIDIVAKEKPDILALSSLMTTTMMRMKEIINILENKKLRNKIKVIIGGAPVNEAFAKKIKADGYGKDAVAAVRLIERLTSE